jgi:hypothetical protein
MNAFMRNILLVSIFHLISASPLLADDVEPIAYIGHGAFFDHNGNQITLTPDFVSRAQDWYRKKLLAGLRADKKAEFAKFERKINTSLKADGQAALVVKHRLLEWLMANSKDVDRDGRTMGKLNALKFALQRNLETGAEFRLDPELERKLKLPDFKPSGGVHVLSATMNKGQAYLNECAAAGVPIPPPIGRLDPAGLTGWKSQGFIPQTMQFIVGTPAEVRTFKSTTPPGMCIALPRYRDSALATVDLDGVICLGQTTSKSCFWDNQMNGAGFSFASGTQIPIGVPDLTINAAGQYQAGGFELLGGSGGVCTDCHAGQNPYIVHPLADLGGGVLMGSLGGPPQNLPTFSVSRYDPLVAAAWPQNQLSQSPTYVPAVCKGCHVAGGQGGAFPHLSTELPSYCNTILAQAISKTMPPGAGGSQANNPEVIALKAWCNSAATAGPSDRGDPHLTTTNGIDYDFQAAGEFTALRNSSNNFELQTRQTAVSTTSIPGANPHTGLASCVSLNTAAAVRAGKHRITYQPSGDSLNEQLVLRIDGRVVRLPSAGINLGNGNMIAKADGAGGIDVSLSDGTHVIITPNFWASEGYWYLDIQALSTPAREGTMGHIMDPDWLPNAPDGSSFGPRLAAIADRHVMLNQNFADAWRVTNTTSLFDYEVGTSTADFTDRSWPPMPGSACVATNSAQRPVKPMHAEKAHSLCRGIKDKAVYANCVFDLVATGNAGMAKGYRRALKLKQKAGP